MQRVDFDYTVGDTLVPFMFAFQDPGGAPVDLTDTTVTFSLYPAGGGAAKVLDGACTIESPPTAGLGHYIWQAADVDTAGLFYAWLRRSQAGKHDTKPAGRQALVRFNAIP